MHKTELLKIEMKLIQSSRGNLKLKGDKKSLRDKYGEGVGYSNP